MPIVKARVIDVPETRRRTVFAVGGRRALVLGGGPFEVQCGGCGRLLIQGARTDQLENAVARCPGCDALNDLDGVGGPAF